MQKPPEWFNMQESAKEHVYQDKFAYKESWFVLICQKIGFANCNHSI